MLDKPFDHNRIRKTTRDGVAYYSLVDIVREFSSTEAEARYYWRDTKNRLKKDGFELWGQISQSKLTAPDGKKRLTDVADAETCMRIVQSIPSPKAEPVRQWLARVAVERIEEAADPELGVRRAHERAAETYKRRGKDDKWISGRLKGIDDRKAFTDMLQKHVADIAGKHYGQATNRLYLGLWGRDAEQLRRDLGLPPGTNIRDYQPNLAHHYQGIVEITVAAILGQSEQVTPEQALHIIEQVASMIGAQASELGFLLGIDPATGQQRLLK